MQAANLGKYLNQHWHKANELVMECKINTSKRQALIAGEQIKTLKELGMTYLKYAYSFNMADNVDINAVAVMYASEHSVGDLEPLLVLGLSIKEELQKIDVYRELHRKVSEYVTSIIRNASEFDIDIDLSSDEESEIMSKTKDSSSVSSISNIYMKSEFQRTGTTEEEDWPDLFEPSEIENVNSDEIKHEVQEIKMYLNKLQAASTELNYLCHRMRWPQAEYIYAQSKINPGLFACEASLSAVVKGSILNLTSKCMAATSKKQARRVASLFLLKKIYHRIPEAWTRFKKHREGNPEIQLPLDASNQGLFRNANVQFDLNIIESKKFTKRHENTQIQEYLKGLKNYKTQLNLLLGQFKKITPPVYRAEAQNELSLWPVEISLFDNGIQLKAEASEISKKAAEEACCRQILMQLYSRNLIRWKQFRKFKQGKKLS